MNKSDREGFGAAIASLSFKVALGLCLACGLCLSSSATTYYVSPSGDDSASGLSDAPVKSLSVVLAKAANGDTINVAAGDYNLLVPGEVLISTKETNLSDSLTGTDFDPCFRLYGTRNYRLRRVSPAINAGDSIGWTAADTDLDGAPRLYGKEIDIGCYERQGSGFGIIIR